MTRLRKGWRWGPCWHSGCRARVMWPPRDITTTIHCNNEWDPHTATVRPIGPATEQPA